MTIYSNSKISTFENCPHQYKLKYIDKIEVDFPTTIEAFMGDMVHEALEMIYQYKQIMKVIVKENLLNFYNYLWEKNYTEDILIVKPNFNANNYKKMGERFISEYYDRYAPFEEMAVLGLETRDKLLLPDGNFWHVRIDKLGKDQLGNYYVCDYKTGSRMKSQEEADNDRQLAMYCLWVKKKFSDAKSVFLRWHMLAFNQEVTSIRTDDELRRIQQEVMDKIKQIESAKEFPRVKSGLCAYCSYQNICSKTDHEGKVEAWQDLVEGIY